MGTSAALLAASTTVARALACRDSANVPSTRAQIARMPKRRGGSSLRRQGYGVSNRIGDDNIKASRSFAVAISAECETYMLIKLYSVNYNASTGRYSRVRLTVLPAHLHPAIGPVHNALSNAAFSRAVLIAPFPVGAPPHKVVLF